MEKSERAFCVGEKIVGQAFHKIHAKKDRTTPCKGFIAIGLAARVSEGVRKAAKGAFIMQHFKIHNLLLV